MNEELEKEKISIIVPAYKVEPFIRKCIRSVLNQTHKNIEVILVDDESPDNSGKICDAFAAEDSRIKVIHQKNRGLCGARNAGLDVATGDYIGFVDSDDWVDPDMFEYLLKNLKSYEADISACRYYRVWSNNKIAPRTDGKTYIYNKEEAIAEIVNNYTLRTWFWNKLFKKEFFENIRFPEGKVFEGTSFMHEVLEPVNKIVLLPEPKYYYLDFDESIINVKTIKNQADCVCAHIKRYNDLHKKYPELKDKLIEHIAKECINLIKVCKKRKREIKRHKENLQHISEFVKANYKQMAKSKSTSRASMEKLKYFISLSRVRLCIANSLIGIGKVKKSLKKWKKKWKKKIRKFFKMDQKQLQVGTSMEDLTKEDKQIFDRLHKVELELVDEFVRICDKYDLKYYLYGGTLLGAVRHQGFIPWDDDIDIVMLREDYEKFGECCKEELNEKYFYQTCFTDTNYPLVLSKIRLNNSLVEEELFRHLDFHKGIYIDILPLDAFPMDKCKGRKVLKKFDFMNRVCVKNRINTLKIHWKILFRIRKLFPKEFNYKRRDKFIQKFKNIETENVCSFGSHYRPLIKRVLKKSWFEGDEYMTFEGRQYRVPRGWKEYLIHLYGDSYMEWPPVEKRINHFNFYEINFNTREQKHEKV